MILQRIHYLFLFTLLVLCSCKNSATLSCYEIPDSFDTYKDAKETILKSTFSYTDHLGQGKSSWISNASYYSCDGTNGYFILYTKNKDYLFQDMPLSVWKEFITASSHGAYFNDRIKGNFQYILKSK